jgi:hypothetical protein
MLTVFFHRFTADTQFRRDLFVGFTFGNQSEYLHLPRTQADAPLLERCRCGRRLFIMIVEALGNERPEERAAFLNFPNRLGKDLGRGLFGYTGVDRGLPCQGRQNYVDAR